MEAPIGPPATRTCEPGQARKGAATARDVCAGMWLVGASTRFRVHIKIPTVSHLSILHCLNYDFLFLMLYIKQAYSLSFLCYLKRI